MLPRGAMLLAIVVAGCVASIGGAQQSPVAPPALRAPDVAYEPTATEVVHAMLRLAKVTAGDVVYDLGCGDGRIVITAVRDFGARGVGVDIDPLRIAESRENARQTGVTDRVRFLNEDLFLTDIGEATVVTLFLSQEVNLAVRSKLQRVAVSRVFGQNLRKQLLRLRWIARRKLDSGQKGSRPEPFRAAPRNADDVPIGLLC